MRHILTKELIEGMVYDAKKCFFDSNRSDREKYLLNEITPFIYLNDRLRKTWGVAWICHMYHPDRYDIGIPNNYPRAKIEGRFGRFILEINPSSQYASKHDVCDTVSHELAHLLDFRLNGYYNRDKKYHHQGWKDIHRAMGGNGEPYGPKYIDLSGYKKYRNFNIWRG